MSTPVEIGPAHRPLTGGGVDLRLHPAPFACVSAIQAPDHGGVSPVWTANPGVSLRKSCHVPRGRSPASYSGQSRLLAGASRRSRLGRLVKALVLPGAEADAAVVHLPVNTAVGLPSRDDSRRGARAREHLIAGKPHRRATGVGAPKTMSPYVTWAYWWMRPPSRSRRGTRPAVPSPTCGYTRGIRQVYRRSGGQDHFVASALPDSCAGTDEDYGPCPPSMRVPDAALRSAETFSSAGDDRLPALV